MATKKTPPAEVKQPEQATGASAETAAQTPTPEKPIPPAHPFDAKKGTAGWVDAKLKTRHCEGGVCKDAGQVMRMTRGTYERLKQYGRVE
jgi:hypothetical protein